MWTHVDRGEGQKRDFFVDVINGWPLTMTEQKMKASQLPQTERTIYCTIWHRVLNNVS